MNKSVFGIVALAAAYFSTTGFTAKEGQEIGTYMPEIEVKSIADSRTQINLAKTGSDYLLINFWNPADAESRLVGKNYQTMLRQAENLRVIAVSTSPDISLTREVARLDGRDIKNEFTLSDDLEKTVKNLKLTDGNKTFLIDGNGEIRAVNPSASELTAFLR